METKENLPMHIYGNKGETDREKDWTAGSKFKFQARATREVWRMMAINMDRRLLCLFSLVQCSFLLLTAFVPFRVSPLLPWIQFW